MDSLPFQFQKRKHWEFFFFFFEVLLAGGIGAREQHGRFRKGLCELGIADLHLGRAVALAQSRGTQMQGISSVHPALHRSRLRRRAVEIAGDDI